MSEMINYNLSMPVRTYNDLKEIAAAEGISVADLLRRATKLLLFVRSIKQDPGARLLVERKGEIQEIVIDLIS
jgi:hypothetical protein